MIKKNIQILAETMTRCAGNCSGCALSSTERMDTTFDFKNFKDKTEQIAKLLKNINPNETESISLFLGQGDHFLISESLIESFVEHCSIMIPEELKEKTVVFITASAIGKHETTQRKMDLFYKYSVKHDLPFFIQVVFDPKKMKLTKKFQEIYIKNILYFKEKCGMTEVTINMGEDLINNMTPLNFHEWIKEYQFKHIEMNWVINQFTHPMWINIYPQMIQWLKDWLSIYLNDAVYEINFIPFLGRHFLRKDIPIMDLLDDITNSLNENFYIDSNGKMSQGQMGLISNLTPFTERLSAINDPINANKIVSKLLKKKSCSECEYISVCALSGVSSWFSYADKESNDNCPWKVKDFLQFFESNILNAKRNNICFIDTRFNKNPVQSTSLINNNNATHTYFEDNIK